MKSIVVILAVIVALAAPALAANPFVIGMYGVPPEDKDLAALREMGVTHVHVYTLNANTPERVAYAQNYLDQAHKHGLKVMFDFNGKKLLAVADGLAQMRSMVERFKDHPALGMWYLYDEPIPDVPVAKLKTFYDDLKRLTPDIPIATCFNHAESWYDYAPATDIILNDFYPVRGNAFPESNLQITTTFTREALHTGRQVMPVLQSFNWACLAPKGATTYRGSAVDQLRYPNESELRYMIYANLAQGVDGLFFYSYLRGQRYDPKWFAEIFAPTVRELNSFIKTTGAARPSKIFRVEQDFEIYAALWQRDDIGYLVMCNGQPKARTLTTSLGSSITSTRLEPFGKTKPVTATIARGRIIVQAGPWEVFAWKLAADGSTKPTQP